MQYITYITINQRPRARPSVLGQPVSASQGSSWKDEVSAGSQGWTFKGEDWSSSKETEVNLLSSFPFLFHSGYQPIV